MNRYLTKLLSPLPLAALVVSTITVWMTGVWWIVPLGFAAAGIVAFQSVLSEYQESAHKEEAVEFELDVLHPMMRKRFGLVLIEKEKILKELREEMDISFLNGQELASRVNEQVKGYYDLLVKLERIRPFVNDEFMRSLKTSIEDLERQIKDCSDDLTRENLSQALKRKMDQMNRLTDLAKYRSRVESQLENLLATLNSLYVRIVQMRLSPDSTIDPTGDIKESINNMLLDVGISEKVNREYRRIVEENGL